MRIDLVAAVGIAAAFGMTLAASTGMAGDHGYSRSCSTGECYTQVRQADVYGVAERPFVIKPAHTTVTHTSAAILDRVQRVEVVPGSFNVRHQPALYGSYTRTVMVSHGRTVHSHVPATYKVVPTQEVVRPAHVRWEYVRDAHGRMTKCKIVTPAVTRTVMRSVMVSPAHSVASVVPARFAQVQQPVLLQRARTHQTYNLPAYGYVSQPMVIRPAAREAFYHPPVIGMKRHEVLVRRGGYAWAPTHGRHW